MPLQAFACKVRYQRTLLINHCVCYGIPSTPFHRYVVLLRGMQYENTQNVYNLRTSPNQEYKSRIIIKTM
jgi:hypothetical protein